MNGIFNVDKPAGLSSHTVVANVRRMSGASRVGHAGTLDPMATGVLLVCIGQGVRVTEYLIDHDKKYRARVRLGIETDTYDATGHVVAQRAVNVTRDQVADALQTFVGKIEQLPPAYSAIKKDGVAQYKLARRGVQVEMTARQVEIFSMMLIDTDLPDVEFEVHCSKGTYIRSLAHDLGEKLGCGAHLSALRRTAVAQFSIEDAVSLDELRNAFANGYAPKYLNPLDEALLQFQAIVVNSEIAKQLQQGIALTCGAEYSSSLLRAYSTGGECIALLERGSAPGVWKPKKVFGVVNS
ncbi:MAG: tRNA pseudouridine(55) synthase TruB [Chloroflexi bacterium]|nr:tRNA pseudouridine(55) synthase TruB [Chloroflexota bacterium]